MESYNQSNTIKYIIIIIIIIGGSQVVPAGQLFLNFFYRLYSISSGSTLLT